MFYCPNCNNIYDITKNIPENPNTTSETPSQVSSTTDLQVPNKNTISSIVRDIVNKKDVDEDIMKNITIDTLLDNIVYKRLGERNKKVVYDKFVELIPDFANPPQITSNAYFMCTNCGNHEPIKSNTLIINKTYTEEVGDDDDIDNSIEKYKKMVHNDILPITRNYICPNKNCKSHSDHSLRSAKFFRNPSSFRVRYICMECREIWIP